MSKPTAIVTGGASGMGLACAKHLLLKGYKVVIADMNTVAGGRLQSELGGDVLFHPCDVARYEDQTALFKIAFAFGGDRLDFLAANAGVDDRQDLYQAEQPLDANGDPISLNMKAVDVNLCSVFQSIWLFRYYARKSGQENTKKIVITSSISGLYGGSPLVPQYMASKCGSVGLGRSAGLRLLPTENISVNVICPSFVITGLAPSEILAVFPTKYITPMSTVIAAYDLILDDDTMTGEVVEASLDQLYLRKPVDYSNESQKWICESHDLWERGYKKPPQRREP